MGKEQLTIEVDAALMEQLRSAGVDPQAYVQQVLARQAATAESESARALRAAALRAENQAGLDAYDRIMDEIGDWSAELRTF